MNGKTKILITVGVLAAVVIVALTMHAVKSGRSGAPTLGIIAKPAQAAEFREVLTFGSSGAYEKLEAEDRKIVPVVADYQVKPDLTNVANLKDFKGMLGPKLTAGIARNKFAVAPTNFIQMFQIYEENEYHRPEKIPAFITTDAMLHTYHVFYDYSLRIVETTKLYAAAVDMTDAMLAASQQDYRTASDSGLKDAARRNVAYFAVARYELTGKEVPKEVSDIAGPDIRLIDAHNEWLPSEVTGITIDFSQFVPRGHYTRSEKLKKYFKAMMWYGLSSLPVKDKKAFPGAPPDLEEKTTRMALMMVRNLRMVNVKGKPVIELWDKIYRPTAFYVGVADDFTVYDYAKLSDKLYGKSPEIEKFADKAGVDRFMAAVNLLQGPRIENYVGLDPHARTGRQFRFMGQRFIPDSRVLQELSYPKVQNPEPRNFPTGLDVFAAMGSERALTILRTDPSFELNTHVDYQPALEKMRAEQKSTTRETWQSNLYYGWLWSLSSLVKPVGTGYPAFMKSDAWTDKCLISGLGSWTELRHDTILYAKQSSAAECGGAEEKEPTMPKGYVEPNLEFWTKLQWLNEYTRQGLSSRGLLNKELISKFDSLGEWISFCRDISVKELTKQRVTDDEYKQMEMFGPDLEALTLSFAGDGEAMEVTTDTDKNMAVVADVHTYESGCLEEGTGRAAAIYVVVPIEGKLYLTRGAVYTQYEFTQPSDNRLTDEEWQKMLAPTTPRPMAGWTRSFYIDLKKPDVQFLQDTGSSNGGGC